MVEQLCVCVGMMAVRTDVVGIVAMPGIMLAHIQVAQVEIDPLIEASRLVPIPGQRVRRPKSHKDQRQRC
jgi:hypothetical protein